MNTYRRTYRAPDHVSQSRVVHSGQRLTGCLNRWSVQVMRSRSRHGARYGQPERRGWTLFLSFGGYRAEVGTR